MGPIAVFDSGVGGLSVLRELVAQMPSEHFLYFGDSANAPYGTRPTAEIRSLTLAHAERLFDRGAKALVVACNTATSAAIGELRAMGLDLDDASRRRLLQWQTLTPGDFAAVERQSRFRPLNCAAAFVDRLGEEIKVKGLPSTRKIGFC